MLIFLASSYHSGSHRSWAEGYAAASRHEVHLITMPGSFWQWRLTGGFVTLAAGIVELAAKRGRPDVLLTTSMVDVAGLRGMLAPRIGSVPTVLYMHENQVTYPTVGRNRTERNYGLINWTSLLAADAVAFNSEFHRTALAEALPAFLREFPDQPQSNHLAEVFDHSTVLPVGCDLGPIPSGPKSDPPLVLWNHRWDRDKDPGSFLRLMHLLSDAGADFTVGLAGERFVNQRPEFEQMVESLGGRLVVDGYLEKEEYRALLGRTTAVVSTSRQEFFGVSVVEAIHAGAYPILPNRLVYPERVSGDERFLYDGEEGALSLLLGVLDKPARARADAVELVSLVSCFDWPQVAPAYDDWLESVGPS